MPSQPVPTVTPFTMPATATTDATLAVVVASSAAGGFGVGEFATVTCDLAVPGAVPPVAGFILSGFSPADLFLAPAAGLTAAVQVTFQ